MVIIYFNTKIIFRQFTKGKASVKIHGNRHNKQPKFTLLVPITDTYLTHTFVNIHVFLYTSTLSADKITSQSKGNLICYQRYKIKKLY